jgi:hypothetical protein
MLRQGQPPTPKGDSRVFVQADNIPREDTLELEAEDLRDFVDLNRDLNAVHFTKGDSENIYYYITTTDEGIVISKIINYLSFLANNTVHYALIDRKTLLI